MNTEDAVALLSGAVPRRTGVWIDFGSGDGTFTRALAELLGSGSTVYAIDRDPRAIASLAQSVQVPGVELRPFVADFTYPIRFIGSPLPPIDGMLFANALHYMSEPEVVLGRLVAWLRPGGSVVIVEYDRRAANRWVPYPIGMRRLSEIATAAGLSEPSITATRPSSYGGDLYVARLNAALRSS